MAPVLRADPYAAHNFELTIIGIVPGKNANLNCQEISGLEAAVAAIDYRTGTDLNHVRKVAGLTTFTNLVCKRGITGDLALWNWILAAMNGDVQRKEGSIALLDEGRNEVLRWNIVRAWPAKWTGPGLNAKNNEIAMETLEIVHEGLSIDGQQGS